MKGKLIELNKEYAVRFRVRGSTVGGTCIRKCLVVDKRSNGKIVVSYDAKLPKWPDNHYNAADIGAGRVEWEDGHRLAIVGSVDFIAPWSDWTPPGIPDGRVGIERPRTNVVDGITYTEDALVGAP